MTLETSSPSAVRARSNQSSCGALIEWLDPGDDFNFHHFRARHMIAELLRGACNHVVLPGAEAPDFELMTTEGERLRLSSLRGHPVLLHFVSYTCPVTRGGAQMMKVLHRQYGARIQFVDLLVRQAHPGGKHKAYDSLTAKRADAVAYQQEESIEWPVVVDELRGPVQSAYGGAAASVYLIDSEGTVSFCGVWGQSPLLLEAFDALLATDGVGAPVGKGMDRVPHLGPAIVYGRRGPASGGWRALIDLELGFPGANLLMALGFAARPALGPLVLRTAPIPKRTRNLLLALAGSFALLTLLASRYLRQRCLE